MSFLNLIFVLPYSFVIFFGKLFLREQTTLIPKSIFNEILLAYDFALILIYFQIAMKFFVLIIFSRNFRLCFKRLVTCRCLCCCCESTTNNDFTEHDADDGIYM